MVLLLLDQVASGLILVLNGGGSLVIVYFDVLD